MLNEQRFEAHKRRVRAHKYDLIIKRYFAALRYLHTKGAFRNLIAKNILLLTTNNCFLRGGSRALRVIAYQNVHGCSLARIVSCSRCRSSGNAPCSNLKTVLVLLPFVLKGDTPQDISVYEYVGVMPDGDARTMIQAVLQNERRIEVRNPYKHNHHRLLHINPAILRALEPPEF